MTITRDYEIGGVTLEKLARLMRAVAASGNNVWVREGSSKYRITTEVAGIVLHLVEELSIISLRGDGWMISLTCDLPYGTEERFCLPSTSGREEKSRNWTAITASVSIGDVKIKSANAFKHDMAILLMFESEWVE